MFFSFIATNVCRTTGVRSLWRQKPLPLESCQSMVKLQHTYIEHEEIIRVLIVCTRYINKCSEQRIESEETQTYQYVLYIRVCTPRKIEKAFPTIVVYEGVCVRTCMCCSFLLCTRYVFRYFFPKGSQNELPLVGAIS